MPNSPELLDAPKSGDELARLSIEYEENLRKQQSELIKQMTAQIAELRLETVVCKSFLKQLGITEADWQRVSEEVRLQSGPLQL